MIFSVLINGTMGFAYIITVLYAITDATSVLESTTGLPIIEVFYQSTGSGRAATAMLCAVILVFSMALFGIVASTSRLMWAFARDHGLPFSRTVSHITSWNQCPTNAVLITFTITCLLSLINIGSTTAFNALLALANIGFYFSYAIPILVFAMRRFNTADPIRFGPWRMPGSVGLPVNILAVVFCVFIVIFVTFPPMLPVTGENMNYAAPVFVGVMGFAIIDYFIEGKRRYVGPIKEVRSQDSSEIVEHAEVFGPEKKG